MKAVMIEPHLQLRGSTYYFRMAIPKTLVSLLGFSEYKKSLRTKDYHVARRKSRIMSHVAEGLFGVIGKMTKIKPHDEVREIARMHFEKKLLDASEAYIGEREVFPQDDPEGFDPQTLLNMKERSTQHLQSLQTLKKNHTYGKEQEQVADRLIKDGLIGVEKDSERYRALCYGLLNAQYEAEQVNNAYLSGNEKDGVITNPYFKGCKNFFENPDPELFFEYMGLPYYKPTRLTTVTLKQAVELYLEYERNIQKDNKNVITKGSHLDRMLELLREDEILKRLEKQPHGSSLRNMLFHLPKNYTKKYKQNGIKIQEALASNNNDKILPKTRNEYWNTYNGFFRWCIGEGYINLNPLEGMDFKYEKSQRGKRYPFTKEQLEVLFHSPIYTGRENTVRSLWKAGSLKIRDAYFWIPLIGLFTGLRLGEILQLMHADIRKDEKGTFYFDINKDDEGKSLKTEGSKRKIPVHPELLKIGFIEYWGSRERVCRQKNKRLFEDNVTYNPNDLIKNYSRSFGDYLKNLGIKKDEKIVFHSFRHSYVDKIRRIPQVQNEVLDALDGRESGTESSKSTRRLYGTDFTPSELYEYLRQIDYGIDFTHLYKDG